MIRKEEILERARSWGLRADVVEKDYVLGWLLAALSRNIEVRTHWVFKGGTCLKKCFFETYRFSEDLDFSIRPDAPYTSEALTQILRAVAEDAHQLSGIDFSIGNVQLVERQNKQNQRTFQGKVPYRGPLVRPQYANILFDLTQHEPILDQTDDRPTFHAYPDGPEDLTVVTYSIEELFAEKTRALLDRTRPRDLYDVVQIVENHSESIDLVLARELFQKKCAHKGIPAPSSGTLRTFVLGSEELRADWDTMLAHQLPILPPIEAILERLEGVLAWLDANDDSDPNLQLQPMALGSAQQGTLVAPPSVTFWGSAPIEQIRFAGANRLMISFIYKGKQRLAEPYALRRSAAGHISLFAHARGDPHIKQFRVDDIEGLTVSDQTFDPKYRIELTGSIVPSSRKRTAKRTAGLTYVFRCPACGRDFHHERNNPALRPHQDATGCHCRSKRGQLERIEH